MDTELIWRILPFIGEAALTTAYLTVCSLLIGLTVAAILTVARFAKFAPIRWIAAAYISVIRGTPLLVQLFLVYFGGPQFGLDVSAFVAAILTMGFNIGAYMSVGMRGAIMAVDKGQSEASRTLGFSRFQTMTLFVLPQAAQLMARSLGVNAVILAKSTALVSTVGVVELTYSAQRLVTSTYKPFEVFGLAGAAYIIIVSATLLIVRLIESRFDFAQRYGA